MAEQGAQQATGSLAALAGSGLDAAYAGAGEMMKQTAANISTQMAAEATKAATKQALINGGLQVAGSATQMVGQKFTQKDSQVEDKNRECLFLIRERKNVRQIWQEYKNQTKLVLIQKRLLRIKKMF